MQNVRKNSRVITYEALMICAGIPCVTDCVLAELEKLGHRYRVALRSVSTFLKALLHPHRISELPETPVLNVYLVHTLAPMLTTA